MVAALGLLALAAALWLGRGVLFAAQLESRAWTRRMIHRLPAPGDLMPQEPEAVVQATGALSSVAGALAGVGVVNWVAVVAIFLSNIPEGLSSSAGMKKAGRPVHYVFGVWTTIAVVSGAAALVGYAVFRNFSSEVIAATTEVERLVGEINGELGQPGWIPVHYFYRPQSREELVAYYRAASVCLATPLKNGMNLVTKEYCACQVERGGVLVLSEFAGAAIQLAEGALLVNPYDILGVAAATGRACEMPPIEERRRRMARLQRNVLTEDVHGWVDHFLAHARGY